jgi:hypothetical protein
LAIIGFGLFAAAGTGSHDDFAALFAGIRCNSGYAQQKNFNQLLL